jgi:hypothetical protein
LTRFPMLTSGERSEARSATSTNRPETRCSAGNRTDTATPRTAAAAGLSVPRRLGASPPAAWGISPAPHDTGSLPDRLKSKGPELPGSGFSDCCPAVRTPLQVCRQLLQQQSGRSDAAGTFRHKLHACDRGLPPGIVVCHQKHNCNTSASGKRSKNDYRVPGTPEVWHINR